MRVLAAVSLLVLVASPLRAQSEEQLRDAFEGRSVVVRIDMPATARGVDVRPAEHRPIDMAQYADRIKDYGTALRAGTSVMVTKVKVKKDLIEVQLGGGGYGTFGDESGDVSLVVPGKSAREKSLEKDIKAEKDAAQRKAMQEELDHLRSDREAREAVIRASAARTEAVNKERVRQKALEAGSRFNVRFQGGLPAEALTPEGLRRALAEYVDFSPARSQPAAVAAPPADCMGGVLTPLRKGMSQVQVEAILGPAASSTPVSENGMRVLRSTYDHGDAMVVAEYVENVLVRFTIKSK